MAEVYINSKFVGNVDDPIKFIDSFREQRRSNKIDAVVNVHYDNEKDTVHLDTTSGRLRRPLIVVKNSKSLLTKDVIEKLKKNEMSWEDLVSKGIIEYLDAAEEENSFVAIDEEELTNEHTHIEVAPYDLFGIAASLVPFANYSSPTRILLGTKNMRFAQGVYSSNYHIRYDVNISVLETPQNPIVRTITNDLSGYAKHPSGQNFTIAVMQHEGYNMEDAIVMNRASIERGLGKSFFFRPYDAEEIRYPGGLVDEITIPNKDTKDYRTENDYRLLEDDGIIYPGANVSENDVVVGKISPPRFLSGADEYNFAVNIKRDSSVALKHGQKGVVDQVIITENSEGNRLIRIKVRDVRIPEVGDKFTSRHGQKGIVGMIVPQEDMPFSSNGIVPDLIFSPHSLPSRMTLSHMLELLAGKVGALAGRAIDATTFECESADDLRDSLRELGFKDDGTEVFYDGKTGKMHTAKIFVGNMFYEKLVHMVSNKAQARSRGPIQLLTRQPTEGKAKEGGLRLGEMEQEAFVAHGAALLLKERFSSDMTKVPICSKCGIISVENRYTNKLVCPVCDSSNDIDYVEIAYAFKLVLEELESLGIRPELKLKTKF